MTAAFNALLYATRMGFIVWFLCLVAAPLDFMINALLAGAGAFYLTFAGFMGFCGLLFLAGRYSR